MLSGLRRDRPEDPQAHCRRTPASRTSIWPIGSGCRRRRACGGCAALEEAGVIRKYVTLLDPAAVEPGRDRVRADLARSPGGGPARDLRARDPQAPRSARVLPDDRRRRLPGRASSCPTWRRTSASSRTSLTRLEGVAGIKSSFALKQVKYSTVLPLEPIEERKGDLSGDRDRGSGFKVLVPMTRFGVRAT